MSQVHRVSSEFGRVLVVEDDPTLIRALKSALEGRTEELTVCSTVADARTSLVETPPSLLILDVCLPDGTALDVLGAMGSGGPTPAVLAISGSASADTSFQLARLGVVAFLSKPFAMADLLAAMHKALKDPVDLRPQLRALVGNRSMDSVISDVRTTMLDEALARERGSRRGAARILAVSRQVVQYMLRTRTD